MAVGTHGKAARRVLHVHRYNAEHDVTLATVDIHTGRMHQIRVHCAHSGAPIAGDNAYGEASANRAFQQVFSSSSQGRKKCKPGSSPQRPLLHAWMMELPHPCKEKERLKLCAPLPKDMLTIICRLWPDL